MAQIHLARLNYFKNFFAMLETALEIDKLLKYEGNDECMWEMD